MKKNKFFITIIIIALLIVGFKYISPKNNSTNEQARLPENNSDKSREEVLSYNDMIKVFNPLKNDVISSPLKIKGEARGGWYFEASFPIKLVDGNGKKIELNQNYIMTDKEWTTEDYVSFEQEIIFKAPDTKNGTLILEKANPSGKPELEEKMEIPVEFKSNSN